MANFSKWSNEFSANNLYAFNHDANGLLWLKVRAVCRGRLILKFTEKNGIVLHASKNSERNVELFEALEKIPNAMQLLDDFLNDKEHEWYKSLGINDSQLKEDLYKIHHYEWGGDQNNSLDKHLVSRYVKVISNYEELLSRQTEIACNAWNYVQTSWYNNWTSYLIESLFKLHEKVTPAVGEIKSVDFFLGNYPIDLKVTYFPNQYLNKKLKDKLGQRELTWLKQKARKAGIIVDNTLSEYQQFYTLSEKLSEIGRNDILSELSSVRKEVITEAQLNSMELITWFYENQGEMRFGAENRLFVVLVDVNDMAQSWKLKRAFNLIEPKIEDYLNRFTENSLKKIDFTFKGRAYRSLADVIFVVKE